MFLKDIDIIFIEPCIATTNKMRLKSKFASDVSEIMPYLNAIMPNATYNHNGPILAFVKGDRLFALYSQEMTLAKAINTTDAHEMLDWLKNFINDTYERRNSITPDYTLKFRPKPLEIYSWLPRTNCKECGELTCLAFAAKLLLGEQRVEKCAPLFTKKYADIRESMLQIAAALGYDLPEA